MQDQRKNVILDKKKIFRIYSLKKTSESESLYSFSKKKKKKKAKIPY